ncbi:MAG: hypothetical protein DWQ07_10485 [Chloroflexi bacterium]|nr:MAG: hypothetical protein DWQ07_10485 [Chloroflexota bacterium]MBL1192861.1 hypothetical protein [Chloroflexota bacterium]NOH10154.1 hypothetical protein [Chloroflexota bacterium]
MHDVRAYQIIDSDGTTRLVYGEFNTDYAFMRLPTLKVQADHQYRYDPQADFIEYASYVYQEDDAYFSRLVEDYVVGALEETGLAQIEPISGDIYQTLVTYSDQAEFESQSDGLAVYRLEHPEWFKLQRARGFADLGFLYAQEAGEELVEQYVAEHYPDVATIHFTIHVAINEQEITRVVVDDRDFMISVWAQVDRALIEQGANPANLIRYEVLDANGAECLFSNYNQVQDFELPRQGVSDDKP